MKLSKKEEKLLKKIEHDIMNEMTNYFVKLMMELIPMKDEDSVSVKIPCKKYMTKKLEDQFNSDKSLFMSGIIHQFITTWYKRIGQ